MLPAQTPFGIAIVLRALVFKSTRSMTLPAVAHIEPKATTAATIWPPLSPSGASALPVVGSTAVRVLFFGSRSHNVWPFEESMPTR
jgi:hypothetical protein